MKIVKIFLVLLVFCVAFSSVTFAKINRKSNTQNQSVELLKEFTQKGVEVRQNDAPVPKEDVEADVVRIRTLKQKFQDEKDAAFPSIYIQK